MYTYWGKLVAVHDGDTLTFCVDQGFGDTHTDRFRLLGLNAPELATPEGKQALAFATEWLTDHTTVVNGERWTVIRTHKDAQEKYGRYLATVYDAGDTCSLNDALLASGHAKSWDGQGPRPT